MDTELQQLEKTQRNPIQETRYQELKKSQGAGTPNAQSGITGAISALNPESVVRNATQVNDFVRQQNQPVVQSYEASKAPLQQRYKDLIDSIKGNQQIAENRQTVTTNNELGKRGITGSSGVAQQEITNAVNPITQQYTGMIKDSTNQQNIDLSNIDAIIAKLNAGDPTASLSTATNIGQSQQSANEFAQQIALQQAAQEIQRQQAERQAQQQEIENAISQGQLANQTAQTQYETSKPYYKPESGGDTGIASLLALLNGGNVAGAQTPKEPKPQYGMSTNNGPVYYR